VVDNHIFQSSKLAIPQTPRTFGVDLMTLKMKKQKTAFLLSLAWLIGMVAIFSFPPAVKRSSGEHPRQSELSHVSVPGLVSNLSDHTTSVPAFKADLNVSAFLGSHWKVDFVPSLSQYLSPSFFSKSRALFDVLITFFYFFHTW